MKILVCGSRSITDQDWVFAQIDAFISNYGLPLDLIQLIHGGAKGVDSLAGAWAQAHNVKTDVHNAEWAHYGRGAGLRRNKEMVNAADLVLILWDGSSQGTKNDIDLCISSGKQYKLVTYSA